MAKKSSMTFVEDFAFYEQLWNYYISNRGKIRSRYNDLTKKFLAYNDRNENPDAFLRTPQFEALEMYVFIKEFMNNAHMFQMFDDWRNHRDKFSDVSYYTIHKRGQITLLDLGDEQNEAIFKQMKKYRESYPNYIYALTMGLGKTILMGTCIFYEFLLANKYPKDKRFCHNALVFAPDKTVLESLREIMTFDKTKVVPPEYARVLDANIKFHYLDESGTTLQTIDDSDFNIIISNNQKIIVKKKRKEDKPTDVLFGSGSLLADVYGDDDDSDVWDDATLMDNQRFKKLCRLPQLGVYVDEAHHLFGANLEKELRLGGANKTTLRNTINMLAEATSIVACYNYTGTPYVKRQVLPEVVYAYGLRDSISHGFLKDADPIGFDNVKNEEFLKKSITMFWERYGGKTYEGLPPKMAIFAASVAEATDVVRPAVEKILSELNVSLDTILVNTGDTTVTKNDDIRDFNNLDVLGTEGSRKQFIILVEKGREGWNCRSLLGIALFRSPKSKIFVLQATMRCLRKLTDEQLKATVFLSKENLDTLDEELRNNYNMEIKDLGQSSDKKKNSYKVRVLPPPRSIKMKRIWHEYSLIEKEYSEPIDFKVSEIDDAKYESRMYEKGSIRLELSTKETVIDDIKDQMRYSRFSLVGEISRYMNGLYIVIILIFIALCIITPVVKNTQLLTTTNILNILQQASPRMFLALGVAGLILLTGTDLSVGRMVGMGMVTATIIMHNGINTGGVFGHIFDFTGIPVAARAILALAVCIVLTTAFSMLAGFFMAKFKMHPFISTMANMLVIFGLVTYATKGVSFGSIEATIPNMIIPKVNGFPTIILWALAAIIIVWFIWNKTTFGKNLYAVGGNPEAAAVSGISVFAVTLGAFIMAGILYGFGSWLECARMVGSGSAAYGQGWDMDAIAACVVGGVSFTGGIGKISGVVTGVCIFTALTYSLTILGIDTNLQFVFSGIIILVAVTLDCLKYVQKK